MFGESAVAEDAESVVEAALFAKMRIRVSTVIASMTALVRIDGDFIANFDCCDVIANSGDDATRQTCLYFELRNRNNLSVSLFFCRQVAEAKL